MQPCNHGSTEILARRDGVDYVRCLECDQVFEAEDLEAVPYLRRGRPTRRLSEPDRFSIEIFSSTENFLVGIVQHSYAMGSMCK